MPDIVREIEKSVLLENVDKAWMEHLEAMDDLKDYVGLNSYAQRDPVAVYRIESADMFDSMSHDIRENTVRKILTVFPTRKPIKRVEVARETGTGASIPAPKKPVVKKVVLPGRNDPCHCGSGKKYKNCHLMQDKAGN